MLFSNIVPSPFLSPFQGEPYCIYLRPFIYVIYVSYDHLCFLIILLLVSSNPLLSMP